MHAFSGECRRASPRPWPSSNGEQLASLPDSAPRGAIAINLFGGGATAAWLVTGETDHLPKRGKALLWA
jgi:hypothetical protein